MRPLGRRRLTQGTLEANELSALVRERDGALWIQHPRGYLRFDEAAGVTAAIPADVGVLPHDIALGVSIATSDGQLLFGTKEGFIELRPERLLAGENTPRVVLSSVRAGGRLRPLRRLPDGHVTLDEPLRATSFPVTLQFASTRYPDLARHHLNYKMGGADPVRVPVSQKDLTFVSLPAGTNALDAAFQSAAGLRGPEVRVVLSVLPVWYQAWWFRALALLGLSVAVAWGYRWRARAVREDNIRLEELVRDRTAEVSRVRDQLELQNKKLERLDRAKTRFFVNISHDFRTPLTLLLGPIQDMVEQAEGPQKRPLARMHRNALRLLRLINQVMDLARLESGKLKLDVVRVDISRILCQCVGAFEGVAQAAGITLKLEAPPQHLSVDPVQFEKVVLNLLSNAFKFTASGGSITVGVDPEDEGWTRLTVQDTGRGIEPDRLPYLFDRFYQSGDRPGSGVGLALVKELVELHGGTVAVSSVFGEGSAFTARFPDLKSAALPGVDHTLTEDGLATANELDGPMNAAVPAIGSEDLPTVLVVEDNRDLLGYIREQFEGEYTVLEALDGASGLELARESIPDLIVSDVMMPALSGIELLRALRSDRRTSHIPVILLTARADVESMVEGMETGADAYMAKPFQPRLLVSQAASLLAQRKRLQSAFGQPVLTRPESLGLSSVDEAFLGEVRDAVEEALGNPDFGVDLLASSVSLSPRQLSRKMKALLDTSPGAFIRTHRLVRAAHMLAARSGSVKEVAYAVGYRSQTQFSGQFKEQFGTSPGSWDGEAVAKESAE